MKLFKQLNDAIDAQYQKGYRQAIEDAAKVAKKDCGCKSEECPKVENIRALLEGK